MNRTPLPALLGLAASLVACGDRSSLAVGAGGGAATSASASSSAGAGGTGGAVGACDALVLAGKPIGTAPDPFNHQVEPALTFTAEGSVAAVFGQKLVETSEPGPTPIAAVALDPWGVWPSGLGPSFVAASDGGGVFEVAASVDQGLAVFLNPMEDPPFGKMFMAQSVPLGIASPTLGALLSESSQQTRTAFLARGPSRWMAGSVAEGPGSEQVLLSVIHPGPTVSENFVVDGCATGHVAAAGIPMGDGFLVALSSGRPAGQCAAGGPPLGEATHLQLATWSPGFSGSLGPGADLAIDDILKQIALVPRSDGAWVVWQSEGAGAEFPPPIQAMRVDALGNVAGPMISVASTSSAGPFAAAALGDRLAVVSVNELDPSAPTLMVSLLDEAGAPLAGASVSTQPGWLAPGRLSALGRPEGDELLVAWSTLAGMGGPSRFLVARFDCAPKG